MSSSCNFLFNVHSGYSYSLQHLLNISFLVWEKVPQHDISSSQWALHMSLLPIKCLIHVVHTVRKRFEHAIVSTQDAHSMLFLTKTHLVNAFFSIQRSQYAVSPASTHCFLLWKLQKHVVFLCRILSHLQYVFNVCFSLQNALYILFLTATAVYF